MLIFFFQLEYGNKELMTNVESSGSEVITLRKYYIPEKYIQDTIKSQSFFEVHFRNRHHFMFTQVFLSKETMHSFFFVLIVVLCSYCVFLCYLYFHSNQKIEDLVPGSCSKEVPWDRNFVK